jgi:23S rRNA (pseudouridine1915-N3)-methyltransferase
MRIVLRLQWLKAGRDPSHAFKSKEIMTLIKDFIGRTQRFCEVELTSGLTPGDKRLTHPQSLLWMCHLGTKTKAFDTESLCQLYRGFKDRSVKEWHIAIGPADGWTAEDLRIYKPHTLWNLSSLTFPHELVALVLSEQIYRFTSLDAGHPYHRSGSAGTS